MSKKVYIVNCYTCQHNGQETCKGCNTLMNGDVEPYQNWELREDLEQKDKRIAELEQELAELKEKAIVPKFNVGQEVWHFITGKPIKDIIVRNDLFQYELSALKFGMYEDYLFATELEAQAKLKEIQENE